jgi:hypothetical protein
MNPFLKAAIDLVGQHAVSMQFTSVQTGSYDPQTSTVTETTQTFNVKAYPKHIKATQYNYPDLIEKEAILLYLANNNLGFVPSVKDFVQYGSTKYKVYSIEEKHAGGQLVMYMIMIVKG